MNNIEKYCLQGLKRRNKLLVNMICMKKIVCIEVRETSKLKFRLKVCSCLYTGSKGSIKINILFDQIGTPNIT